MKTQQCAFAIGERRCRAAGIATHVTRAGKDTPWFCTTHFADPREGPEGLALMDQVDRDFDEMMMLRRIDPRMANDVMVDNWISEHPQVLRRPGDDRWSHVYRCVEAMPRSPYRTAFLKNLAIKAESVYREIESREDSLA